MGEHQLFAKKRQVFCRMAGGLPNMERQGPECDLIAFVNRVIDARIL